jgi:hypothetical protein
MLIPNKAASSSNNKRSNSVIQRRLEHFPAIFGERQRVFLTDELDVILMGSGIKTHCAGQKWYIMKGYQKAC